VSLLTQALEETIVSPDSFLDDCAGERLRDVSWIDPNFVDLSVLDRSSNDDHPPSDVRAGQAFVLEIYEALRHSTDWEDTLLVIVYDEHGGFYDHVAPPALPFDDGSGYATYGLRVPALLVGPRVARRVCHRLFDHTTLIKTILQRFAADPHQAIARMGTRVAHAPHLGVVLLDEPRSDIPEPEEAREAIDAWSVEARASRRASERGFSAAPDGSRTALRPARVPGGLRALRARHARKRPASRAAVKGGASPSATNLGEGEPVATLGQTPLRVAEGSSYHHST
jgi:phospholipase C